MEAIINTYQTGELMLRVFCGVVFLYQGYDKLFKVKISGVTETFQVMAQKHNIPQFALTFSAAFTSIAEFVGGLLLVLGLFKPIALTLLGLDLILVGVAFSMLEPVWDMRHVFPRLLMVFLLMVLPPEWEVFSLDQLFKK
jgi:putative oxidoreductase